MGSDGTGKRVVALVLLGGGAGLLTGGVHLAVKGPPDALIVPVMRIAGGIMAMPPPVNALLGIDTSPVPALVEGEEFQVIVAAFDGAGRGEATVGCRFTVLDPAVAQVTSAGRVQALAPGQATLVVTYPDPSSGLLHSQSLAFTVASAGTSPAPAPTSLQLVVSTDLLKVGDVVQLAVRTGDGRDVTGRATLSATPAEAATVDAEGRLHVRSALPFTLRATLADPPLSAEGSFSVDPGATCGAPGGHDP